MCNSISSMSWQSFYLQANRNATSEGLPCPKDASSPVNSSAGGDICISVLAKPGAKRNGVTGK